MKSKHLLAVLLCSALGLVLASAFVQRLQRTAKSPNTVAHPTVASESRALAPSPSPVSATKGKSFSWREIESEDYHQYIANLRSIGCPEQTIRDIILADINKLYAARETPLKTAPKRTPESPAGESEEQKLKRLQALRAVQQEKR